MSDHANGAVLAADTMAAGAAALSAISAVHQYQLHEIVGTISGLCAIGYYAFLVMRWLAKCAKKRNKK